MSSGGCGDSTPTPWRRCRSAGKRAAQRHGRDVVRADDQASGFRQPQAPDAFTGHDRIPASESSAWDRRFSAATRSTCQATTQRASLTRADVADRAARAQRYSVGRRACRCRTARRPAHISNLLSRRSRIRAVRSRGNVRPLRVERTVSAAVVRTGAADEGSERQEVRPGAARCARRRQRMSATHA